MKPAKAILAILATFAATSASATTVLHYTGSTAYRGQTSKAIMSSFKSGTSVTVAGSATSSTTSVALSSSNQTFYHGTITLAGTDTDVIIEADWTGSVGGVNALTTGSHLNFLPDALDQGAAINGITYVFQTVTAPASGNDVTLTLGTGNGLNVGGAGTGVYNGYYTSAQTLNNSTADVANSDTFQTSTIYTSPKLIGATITHADTTTSKETVGVVPFCWVRGAAVDASATAISNISNQQINILFGAGQLPASLFTGASADAGSTVYAFGRDPESGTRLTAFAESGLGANATVIQNLPADGLTTTATITAAPVVYGDVAVVDLGLTFHNGNGGEASGGNVAKYLQRQFQTGLGCAISYLSTGDATTALKGGGDGSGSGTEAGAAILNYNGNSIVQSVSSTNGGPTFNYAQLQNGRYTFWGYEHVLLAPSIAATQKTIANTIASAIYNTTAAVFLSSMNVSRPGDGGQVSN